MSSLTDPAPQWAQIANDGTLIANVTVDRIKTQFGIRGVFCTVSGLAELEDADGTVISFPAVAGTTYPLRPTASTSNTTATLYALYG